MSQLEINHVIHEPTVKRFLTFRGRQLKRLLSCTTWILYVLIEKSITTQYTYCNKAYVVHWFSQTYIIIKGCLSLFHHSILYAGKFQPKNMFFLHEMDNLTSVLMSIEWWNKERQPLIIIFVWENQCTTYALLQYVY